MIGGSLMNRTLDEKHIETRREILRLSEVGHIASEALALTCVLFQGTMTSVATPSCICAASGYRVHKKSLRKERVERSIECRIKSPTWKIRATLDGGEQQEEVSRLTDAQQATSSASTDAAQFPSVEDELRLNRRLAIASVVSGAGLFVANRVSGLGADLSTLAARSIPYDEVSLTRDSV